MKNILIVALTSLLFFSSCETDYSNLMPNVTGSAFEVVVVMQDEHWDASSGDLLKEYLGADMIGLPQSEPLFNLVQIPTRAFSDIFKTHRNLIRVKISPDYRKNKIIVGHNLYAKPQIVIDIQAENTEEFKKLILNNHQAITDRLNDKELSRIKSNYRRYEETGIGNKLRSKHDLSLIIPRGYNYDMDTSNFVWITHETPKISQGIFIYYYDYTDTSAFSKTRLIQTRDKILKKYVHGPIENTYMSTEKRLEIDYEEYLIEDQYFAEIRGLWQLEGPDFMGGPFMSLSTVDKERNRVVTVEGYVYAPKDSKRNYLRQVEGILRSLKFEPLEKEENKK